MKILIVDDDPIVRRYLTRLAKTQGYTDIDAVDSGEEALTRVIRQRYDLITLDLRMPGLNGLEIIAILRNMCPHAIIAIISGYIPEKISTEVASCADVMIPKPLDVDVFIQLLEGIERISQNIEQICELGTVPVGVG